MQDKSFYAESRKETIIFHPRNNLFSFYKYFKKKENNGEKTEKNS